MRHVTTSMAGVVKGMDRAMESMNLEKISLVMDKFESQFEDLDVQTSTMEGAMGGVTALAVPQDEVDGLMQQVADENGLELEANLANTPQTLSTPSKLNDLPSRIPATAESSNLDDDALTARLAKLRNS
ncbi:hypothetical protein L0F63_004716 [Massospora cicadina]|nr:hypothetical protein L0F63_004716 [Massospora cicadina]